MIVILEKRKWRVVGNKMECSGAEQGQGKMTIDQCSEKCTGISDMFAFGTNDYGTPRCSDGKCQCLCETASKDGTCQITDHAGYRLYINTG